MAKIEAIFLQREKGGNWTAYNLDDGGVIQSNMPLSIDLLGAISEYCRTVFIESAYHVLACHGMLDLSDREDVHYLPMDDGLPLVIMQDPPTIACYKFGSDAITVLDPANYGMVMDRQMAGHQLIAFRKMLRFRYWPGTAVSAANLFREQLGSDLPPLDTWSSDCSGELLEKAFLGGNCGAGYYGQCPGNAFHHYDLCGAYLWAAEQPLPTVLLDCGSSTPMGSDVYNHIAEVTVDTRYPSYPYRSSNEHADGRKLTCYPVGVFRTVLCGQELVSAFERREVKEVHRWERWDCEPILRQYSEGMRSMVAASHPSIRSAVKTTALAGLGWYARKVKKWEHSDFAPPCPGYVGDFYRLEDTGVRKYRALGGKSMRESVGDYHPDSAPQVWAWIASLVRDRLADVLRRLAGHAMYWDTDSVIVDSRGSALMEGRTDYNVPDGWKKKGTAPTMHVWGYRRYSFGDQIRIGLPVSARDEPGGRMVWESPETWDEAMGHRHMPDGTIVQRHARIRGTYDHGRICEDGKIVPWQIGQ